MFSIPAQLRCAELYTSCTEVNLTTAQLRCAEITNLGNVIAKAGPILAHNVCR